MKVRIVAAIAENGVIGRDGGMPWRLASDMRRFRATTLGKPVVMGRKTWESLPRRPLDGRHNIIVTGNPDYRAEGADIAPSPDAALAIARRGGAAEACVIGGARIYAAALPLADCLDLTRVLARIEGDVRFPVFDPSGWRMVSIADFPAGAGDDHHTRHIVLERMGGRASCA